MTHHGRQITESESETKGAAKSESRQLRATEERRFGRQSSAEAEEVVQARFYPGLIRGQTKLLRRKAPKRAGEAEEERSEETAKTGQCHRS
ncbi:MAG: hypothetical protein ACJ8EL_05840 [Rhizomicrobium sp.]